MAKNNYDELPPRKYNDGYDDYDESYDDYDPDYVDDDLDDYEYDPYTDDYDPTQESDYGYDNFDTYIKHNGRYGGTTTRQARRKADENRRRNIDESRIGGTTPFDKLTLDENSMVLGGDYPGQTHYDYYNQHDKELQKYLDAIDRYDRGDISNYDMHKIQRKYANADFWRYFKPSQDLIEKYGRGNRSTNWPLFRNEGGQWQPEFWRND